jgi:hypothetical protein
MLKQDGHSDLRGSDQRSIILYVYGEICCITVYVLQGSVVELA